MRNETLPAGSGQRFEFSSSFGPAFSLAGGESHESGLLVPGARYSVNESLPAGWDRLSASCDDGSPVSNVDVGPGETVTCTFVNRQRGRVVVRNETLPAGSGQRFEFSSSFGPAFSLADGESWQSGLLVPGAGYSVNESLPAGWDRLSASCDDGSPVSNVDVGPGETVTCTFVNRQRGRVVVRNETLPAGSGQRFEFSSSFGPAFSLAGGESHESGLLVPGAGYSVNESLPAGWDRLSASCDDGSPVSNVDVGPGETVTCTFVNRQRGRVVVRKVTDPSPDPSGTTFDFTTGGGLTPSAFGLPNGGSRAFVDLVPRSGYSVAESPRTGWRLVSEACSDGSPASNIDVAPGETVTCTFLNRANRPPVLQLSSAEVTAQSSDPIPAVTVTATDPDSPTPRLTLTASVLPNDLSLSPTVVGANAVTAMVGGRLNVPAGDYPVQVSVTDEHGASASTTLTVHVLRENAAVSEIAPAAVEVDGNDGDVDSLRVTMVVDEAQDGYLSGTLKSGSGLANAKPIALTLTPVGPGGTQTCSAADTAYVAGDPDSGTATCVLANVGVAVFEAAALIGGNHFVGSGLGAVTVYDPRLGFVTGGGWVIGVDGARVNFGFNAKLLKSGQLQGSLLTLVHREDGRYQVKSNAMGTLAVVEDRARGIWTATFTGKATLGAPFVLPCGESKCGNYGFTVYIEDQAEPGVGADRFWIQNVDPGGAVVGAVSFPGPAIANARTLFGGNIQVPQPQGKRP